MSIWKTKSTRFMNWNQSQWRHGENKFSRQTIYLSDHYGMIVPPHVVNDTYPGVHTRGNCSGRKNNDRYCRAISRRSSVLVSSRGKRHRWKEFAHICSLLSQTDGRGGMLCDIWTSPLGFAPGPIWDRAYQVFVVRISCATVYMNLALRTLTVIRMWWIWTLVRHTRP